MIKRSTPSKRPPLRPLAWVLGAVLSVMPAAAFAQSGFDDPGTKTTAGSSGDLVAVESKIDAGDVALGSSSQVVILFRNDDTKPLQLGEISLYPSSNVSATIAQNKCEGEALAPEAVCAVAFSVKGLQAGKFRIEVLVRHNGRSRLITASMSGNVDVGENADQRNSDLETTPEKIDFGSLNASRPQVKTVLLRNITSQTVDVENVTIQANAMSGYTVDHNCKTLPSGGACVLSVTWSPRQIGPATGAIEIKHNGPTGVANIALDGIYAPEEAAEATIFPDAVPGRGLLISSLSEIDFGTDIEKASAITVSLVNTGDAPLTLNNLVLSSGESGLSISKTGCVKGRVLDPIEACPLTLTWAPTRAGSILDDVQIFHSGARGILVLPVRGKASQGVSRDSQSIVLSDFGNIPSLSASDVEDAIGATGASGSKSLSNYQVKDVQGLLDGYYISSLARERAIVTGAGGSRVVRQGDSTVIAGVPWLIEIKPGAVQFTHAGQSVVMLFDASLSFVNSNESQSSLSVSGSGSDGSIESSGGTGDLSSSMSFGGSSDTDTGASASVSDTTAAPASTAPLMIAPSPVSQ